MNFTPDFKEGDFLGNIIRTFGVIGIGLVVFAAIIAKPVISSMRSAWREATNPPRNQRGNCC